MLLFCRYESLGNAADKPDGLAVLGIMFRLDTEDNPLLESLLDAVSVTKNPGTSKSVAKLLPLKAFLPENTEDFFR